MEDGETRHVQYVRCDHVGLDEFDSFFYCQECGAQADNIILTGIADEEFITTGDGPAFCQEDWETSHMECSRCSHVGLDESNGFFYYQEGANDIILTGVAIEDFIATAGGPTLCNPVAPVVTAPTPGPSPKSVIESPRRRKRWE